MEAIEDLLEGDSGYPIDEYSNVGDGSFSLNEEEDSPCRTEVNDDGVVTEFTLGKA